MKSSVKHLFKNLDPKRHPSEENPRILLGVNDKGEVCEVVLCTSEHGGVVLKSMSFIPGKVYPPNEGASWVNMTGPRGQSQLTYRFLEAGEKIVIEFTGD